MHHPAVKHTLTIFERTYNNLPPLVPKDVVDEIDRHVTSLQSDYDVTLPELEDVMIKLGKQVWPYIQAFEEVYKIYEDKLSDRLLEQKASHGVRKKFQTFKEMGGSFRDVYHGSVHDMFEDEERQELAELLVDLKADVRQHAMQAAISHDRETYEEKIEHYGEMIEEINEVVDDLHNLANEEEHEGFAKDVRDRARAIEQSLVFLGPKMGMDEIRTSREYYEGKRGKNTKL